MTSPAIATSAPTRGGLNLRGDVRLSGMTLNTIDTNGVLWLMSDLAGWWELPDIAMPDNPKPISEDGSYDEDGQYKARLVTVVGMLQAPDSASFQVARRQLMQAVGLVRQTGVLQVDEDIPKQAVCRLVGKPSIDVSSLTRRIKFSVPIKCNDPYKYSIASIGGSTQLGTPAGGRTYNLTFNRVYGASGTPGSISLINQGDQNAGGLISFTGPVQSPSVESVQTGSRLTLNATLNVGDVVVIDLSDQSIVLNGNTNLRSTLSADSSWFEIVSGLNTLRFTGIQQIPPNPPLVPYTTMTVNTRSAWIE